MIDPIESLVETVSDCAMNIKKTTLKITPRNNLSRKINNLVAEKVT